METNKIKMWAEENFGLVQLYDKRRTQRLKGIACRLAENKGSSLARLYEGWCDVKAIYNLLKLKVMIPDTIQSTHRQLAVQNILSSPNENRGRFKEIVREGKSDNKLSIIHVRSSFKIP